MSVIDDARKDCEALRIYSDETAARLAAVCRDIKVIEDKLAQFPADAVAVGVGYKVYQCPVEPAPVATMQKVFDSGGQVLIRISGPYTSLPPAFMGAWARLVFIENRPVAMSFDGKYQVSLTNPERDIYEWAELPKHFIV